MAKRPPKVTPEPDPNAKVKTFLEDLTRVVEFADEFEPRAADDRSVPFGPYQRAKERLHLAADDLTPILKRWGA